MIYILIYSIGSLCKKYQEDGVENITVKSVSFTNAQNGVRIKTWGRPCKTYVRGITYENVKIDNVKHPILIDQNYCPGHKDCPNKVRKGDTHIYFNSVA